MKKRGMVSKKKDWRSLLFFWLVGCLCACASTRVSDQEIDLFFQKGDYQKALKRLREGLQSQGESGRDLLLYLLDLGLTLHAAGELEESNAIFLKADKIADIKDYTQLSVEAGSLLVGDQIKDYKAEDFENVLINTYLAMNYAIMKRYEDALVESRRVNHKLHLMITEGQRPYKQNAFARYLSALLYEQENNINDAYIDYQNTWKITPDFPSLGRDLWRCAWRLNRIDDCDRWDQVFHLSDKDHQAAKLLGSKSKKSEMIILYENGISPIKKPHPSFSQVPRFYPRYNPVSYATVEVDGRYYGDTALLDDIERTAITHLDEKYAGIIAKKIAGIAVKESVAYGFAKATDNWLIGLLARLFFYASDQADLRSWNLLPKDLQILRIIVDPGIHQIRITPVGFDSLPEKTVQCLAGKKTFVNFRYMP